MSKKQKKDTQGKYFIKATKNGRAEKYTYTDKQKAEATIYRLKKYGYIIREASGF